MGSVPAVLIYDAGCPACRKSVDWIRRNALGPDAFEYLPCGAPETLRRFPGIDEDACRKALHLVLPEGASLAGERAFPEILSRIRGGRRAARLFLLPGAGILSRFLYRAFARRRYRFGQRFR